jgi:phosphonate ABC transporter permease subunit PhnE
VILRLMVPPSPGELWLDILKGLAESLAMAFLGTFIAAVVAVPLGFLGARNVASSVLFRFSLRRVLDGMRGVDQLIWALAYVRAVGLGPLAGVLAIATADIAVLAKLYAEAIENAEKKQAEGIAAAGGSPTLVMRFGILPQVAPIMLGHALYFFESNTRSASILGVVGAGGIGLQIAERIRNRPTPLPAEPTIGEQARATFLPRRRGLDERPLSQQAASYAALPYRVGAWWDSDADRELAAAAEQANPAPSGRGLRACRAPAQASGRTPSESPPAPVRARRTCRSPQAWRQSAAASRRSAWGWRPRPHCRAGIGAHART